jgi:hypothetical protein
MDGIHHPVDCLSLAELEAQITELAGHLNAVRVRSPGSRRQNKPGAA